MAKRIAPHALPDPAWPSEEDAAASRLFSPASIGGIEARTRSWVPAMVPWRATDDGLVTPRNVDWYGRFAEGRPGVIVVEATGIRDVPSGPLLRIGHERFLSGLGDIVDEVHRRSDGQTKLFIQIIDFLSIRRRPEPERYFRSYLELKERHRGAMKALRPEGSWDTVEEAALRGTLAGLDDEELEQVLSERELEALRFGHRETVNDLELDHIRELPQVLPELFASAAERAQDVGFDGVELHFAHAYTMASFLSRRNQRDDGYGGSVEGRLRLPLEVIAATRARVGEDFPLGTRFLSDEIIEGGSRLDDTRRYAMAFAEAGLDFLSLSRGGKFEDAKQPPVGHAAYPYTGPSGHECMPTVRIDERGPFGRNLTDVSSIRSDLRAAGHEIPVVAAGGICTFAQAEEILVSEQADFVGAARQSLADPDWWLKMERGRGEEVRRCVFTNYCEGLDQRHKEVTCQLWDRLPIDEGDDPPMSLDRRRRLLPPDWGG